MSNVNTCKRLSWSAGLGLTNSLWVLALLFGTGCGSPPPQGTPYAYPGSPAGAPPDPGFPATAFGVSPPAEFDLDRNVAKMIRQALKADPALARNSRDVHADVSKGVVTLRGTVPSDAARAQVLEQVNRIPGVDGVHDEMGIR